MTRTDTHLDAMLRHLGAAYYESRHGRATRADVTRALDTVEEHLGERSQVRSPARPRHWTRRVSDVMTTAVVTADPRTPYKDVVRLLAENGIRGVPVLGAGRRVVGVVTESDLLAEGQRTAWPRTTPSGPQPRQRDALVAGELMTAPAVTIDPDATIPGATWTMSAHNVRLLPVVDEDERLLGIVSRRDLLSVFLRADEEVAAEVREVFAEVLPDAASAITVTVKNGIVSLAGPVDAGHDQGALAVRLAWSVDGVVDIIDRRDTFPGGARPAGRPA